MNNINANNLLKEMQTLAKQASTTDASSSKPTYEFKDLLKSSLDEVNATQVKATSMTKDFVAGKSNVTLPETMVAVQKSQVSLMAATGVSSHLVKAYHDIFSMPI